MIGEHVNAHPGSIVLNGAVYTLEVNPRSNPPNQWEWTEDPVRKEATINPIHGVTRTPIGDGSFLVEQTQDSWHMGMGHYFGEKPNTYHIATNVDASVPGYLTLGPYSYDLTYGVTGTITYQNFFELGGRLYVNLGRYIREIGGVGTITLTDTADKDWGAGSASNKAEVFQNRAVFALGAARVFESRASGAAAGAYSAAAAGLTASVLATNEMFLYRADEDSAPGIIAACPVESDPLVALSWVSPVNLDTASAVVTSLTSFGYQVLLGKRDGLFMTNREGRIPNLAEDWRRLTDPLNAAIVVVHGGMYYATYYRGLMRYDGNSIESVGLDQLPSLLQPVPGAFYGLASDGKWIYGTRTYTINGLVGGHLFKMTEIEGKPVWHGAIWSENGATVYTGVHVTNLSSAVAPSIFTSSTTTARKMYLPRAGAVPIQDANYDFNTDGGYIYLSRFDFGSPFTTKNFLSISVEADNLNATTSVQPKYRTAADYVGVATPFPWDALTPVWTSAGTKATTTGVTSYSLTNVSGRWIEPFLHLEADNTKKTPIVRRLVIRAIERPTFYRRIKCKVLLEHAELFAGIVGNMSDDTAETRYAALRALEGGTTNLTLIDPWGNSRSVLLVGAIQANPVPGDPTLEPDAVIELTLLEP